MSYTSFWTLKCPWKLSRILLSCLSCPCLLPIYCIIIATYFCLPLAFRHTGLLTIRYISFPTLAQLIFGLTGTHISKRMKWRSLSVKCWNRVLFFPVKARSLHMFSWLRKRMEHTIFVWITGPWMLLQLKTSFPSPPSMNCWMNSVVHLCLANWTCALDTIK